MKNKFKKPPLGLIPYYFWSENLSCLSSEKERLIFKKERLNEIKKTFMRYFDADLNIQIEWFIEYNKLIDEFNNVKN